MHKPMLAMVALLAAFSAASAQDEVPYLDDRSTPEAVIQSYYNAINRSEYSRAYSYFGRSDQPEYNSWEFGYSDTAHVTLVTGSAQPDGAAGSIYYALPVAIEAQTTEGQTSIFAGCYRLRLANPAIQGVPFEPMHIEAAHLERADGPLEAALPRTCDL